MVWEVVVGLVEDVLEHFPGALFGVRVGWGGGRRLSGSSGRVPVNRESLILTVMISSWVVSGTVSVARKRVGCRRCRSGGQNGS